MHFWKFGQAYAVDKYRCNIFQGDCVEPVFKSGERYSTVTLRRQVAYV